MPVTGYAPAEYLQRQYLGQATPVDISGDIEQLRQQQMMAGQQPIPEYTGDPMGYLTDLYFTGQTELADSLAQRAGLQGFKENVARVNETSQADRRAGWNPLQSALGSTTDDFVDNPLGFVAKLGALGTGLSFLGGGAGAGAGGSSGALTGVTLPQGLAPTSAVVGGLGPTLPATAATAAIGPGAASTLSGVVKGAITNAGQTVGGAVPNWVNWANLGSTVLGLYGADRAADAQVAGSQAAIDESRRQFDTTRGDFQPAIKLLGESAGALSKYNSGDTSGFFTSPEYQYNLDQTTKAGERALSAMGLRQSGAMVKEAQRNASGLASRESGAFVDRLLAAAGLGTTGAAASANAGSNSAAMVGNASMNAGNARASGYANQYGALNGGVTNLLLSRYLGRPA